MVPVLGIHNGKGASELGPSCPSSLDATVPDPKLKTAKSRPYGDLRYIPVNRVVSSLVQLWCRQSRTTTIRHLSRYSANAGGSCGRRSRPHFVHPLRSESRYIMITSEGSCSFSNRILSLGFVLCHRADACATAVSVCRDSQGKGNRTMIVAQIMLCSTIARLICRPRCQFPEFVQPGHPSFPWMSSSRPTSNLAIWCLPPQPVRGSSRQFRP